MTKIRLFLWALVVALAGCTGAAETAGDQAFTVAVTTPIESLDGATLDDEVLQRAEQVCPGIRPPFIALKSSPHEPGLAIEAHVAPKARHRFCEQAPDCFFGAFTVARVALDRPTEPQVDVEALATQDDPCWGS